MNQTITSIVGYSCLTRQGLKYCTLFNCERVGDVKKFNQYVLKGLFATYNMESKYF